MQIDTEKLLASSLCLTLMRVGTRMVTLFDQNLADHHITQAQFRVLLEIENRGGDTGIAPSVLADHLLIERGTVTALTSRLVDQGWLSRVPGENRRTFRLCLTAAGRSKLEEVAPPVISLANEALDSVTREELQQLQQLLAKLEAHLRTSSKSAGFTHGEKS